ncbi:hypothetical protein K1T71_002474 [Dendrolimus kikuchii]|uniref:Uncharacterized protein n=1 Tax=Dendrolimus kikuchii TaxID=765133 RepID=A0ACC1DDT7_9NEOP|nr:hypothetical protein K1T71_002474 [Dendrolimus kikuchii]
MGRHKEWRKIAKRERRRKLRTELAKTRDDLQTDCDSLIEALQYEQIDLTNKIENEKWLEAEKFAIEKWNKLQQRKVLMLQQRLEQEAKLKLEWEMEQKKKEEEKLKLQQIEQERKLKRQEFEDNLESFVNGGATEPPKELQEVRETRPTMEPCPFFSKTASCRFGDQCSRNHRYPSISKVLLAANFFVHFGLNNTSVNEYDTDIMLEYDDIETYKEFKEFFYDVLSEFEKFGKIIQFKVCNNYEKHLRGNTYIEYEKLHCAVAAYRALHTRWYGGRQLSLQFCTINSWKNAICGLELRRKCPKGRACNFLHVFRNPNNLFNGYDRTPQNQSLDRSKRTPPRSWRWSESPEIEMPKRKKSHDHKHYGSKTPNHKVTKFNFNANEGGLDKLKASKIAKLNFKCIEDALPFYKLPLKTLIHIQKTTETDVTKGFCSNRLYYISDRIKCPPSILSEKLAKRTFVYGLSFVWIEKSLDVLLEMGVTGDRIIRDLWVLKYHHATIQARLQKVKEMGVDTLYPWMVRCSDNILNRSILISLETKNILGEDKSTQMYLAKRLNASIDTVENMCWKNPALRTTRVTKVKSFLDFLMEEGYTVDEIIHKPKVLAASQQTVKQRLYQLRKMGLEHINLNLLCRSRKEFNRIYESLLSTNKNEDDQNSNS